MVRSKAARVACVIGLMGLAVLTGCLGTSPPVQYYTLQPVAQASVARGLSESIAISIGPVVIPPLLDRPQIVLRDAQNNISFSEYHRWAGLLKDDIAAVIAENLSKMLVSERIMPFTGQDVFQPTHRILVNINRFDSRLTQACVLDATWSLRDLKNKKTIVVRKTVITESLSSASFDDLVTAQSKALAGLSEEMAGEITKMAESVQ